MGLVCLYLQKPGKGMSRPPILKPAWAPEAAGPVLTQTHEGAGAPSPGPPCRPGHFVSQPSADFVSWRPTGAGGLCTDPTHSQAGTRVFLPLPSRSVPS